LEKKKSILVIDDDEIVLDSIAEALRLEGYKVDTAETGKEAIEKCSLRFYNLALIDIRLPDMEGTKLLNAIKDTTPKMVKIIVTGYPSLQNATEALNKGADGYVIKPVDISKLLTTVKEHLQKQEEAGRYSEQRFADFIETRAREAEQSDAKRSTRTSR
jgi:DNA-binding NtrC family response regulator